MDLTNATLRTPSDVHVTPIEKLAPELVSAFGADFNGPRTFGLAHRDASTAAKVIDADVALMLYALREPGAPPRACRSALAHAFDRVVRELIIDGLLELHTAEGWVRGPRAAPGDRWTEPEHPIARRTLQIIQGAAHDVAPPPAHAARLYSADRLPWTRELAESIRRAGGVAQWLGVDTLRPGRRRWRLTDAASDAPWIQHHTARGVPAPGGVTWKLYGGVAPRELPRVFRAVAEAIHHTDAFAFKVGASIEQILRPDKLVFYFGTREHLAHGAEVLRQAVGDVRTHAVPFTAPADPSGAWSWGADPPEGHGGTDLSGRDSWRLHACNEVAIGLAAAQADGLGPDAATRFALGRMQERGIDILTWAPPSHLWQGATP